MKHDYTIQLFNLTHSAANSCCWTNVFGFSRLSYLITLESRIVFYVRQLYLGHPQLSVQAVSSNVLGNQRNKFAVLPYFKGTGFTI